MTRQGLVHGGCAGVVFVFASAPAAAMEPLRVEVRAPTGCGDNASFFDEVAARTPRATLATAADDDAVRTLLVTISPGATAVNGELVILGPGRDSTRRALAGESCAAVVSGLAWVAAQAIDPNASFLPRARERLELPPEVPAAAPPPPPAPLYPSVPAPRPAPAPLPPAPLPPPRSTHAAHSWSFASGAEASVVSVGAPGAALDLDLFAETTLESTTTLAPSARLSIHRIGATELTTPETRATFEWTYARAEGCPWRFRVAAVSFRTCPFADAGALSGSGGAGFRVIAGSHTRPWFTAGELVRGRWDVWGPLTLEVAGALAFPIMRDTFAYDASTAVYQPPLVVGMGSVAVGLTFP